MHCYVKGLILILAVAHIPPLFTLCVLYELNSFAVRNMLVSVLSLIVGYMNAKMCEQKDKKRNKGMTINGNYRVTN